jgi:FkbM family methyltransferase
LFSVRSIFPPADETRMVREFFGNKPNGFFVEVGANDPVEGSQTWHLERAGWSGILVEPQPDLAEKLRQMRKAKVFAVACSSPQHAGGTLPLHIAGAFSSFDPKLMVAGVKAAAPIEVPVRTLDSLLSEARAPVPIDFLSVDVEGHEIAVLSGFDFPRWRPRLILLEDHVVNLEKHRFMRRAGYRLVRRTGLNAWYVPPERALPLGWFGRWQMLRKYYLGLPFRILRDFLRRRRSRSRPQSVPRPGA